MAVPGVNSNFDFKKWKVGYNPVQQTPIDQNHEGKNPFSWNVGGATGVEGVNGAYGVARKTPSGGWVQSEDGSQISCTNSQGYYACAEVATSPFAGKGQAGYSEKPGFEPKYIYA